MMYVLDPDWVQPVDCYCVVRNGIWHVASRCCWHGADAAPHRMSKYQPFVKRGSDPPKRNDVRSH